MVPLYRGSGGDYMSKWEKLRFEEIRKVLESYGYTISGRTIGSSHYTFRKPGKQPITIPRHEPIKRVYVEIVKQVVESEVSDD